MLQVARWYAARGVAVFPLKPGSKVPATAHGVKDATLDPDSLFWPVGCNLGLATGGMFDVIDIDSEQWDTVEAVPGFTRAPEILGAVSTPRGGLHLYIPAVAGARNATGMFPNVDYRAAGGYVVAPPSQDDRGVWAWTMRPTFELAQGVLL